MDTTPTSDPALLDELHAALRARTGALAPEVGRRVAEEELLGDSSSDSDGGTAAGGARVMSELHAVLGARSQVRSTGTPSE